MTQHGYAIRGMRRFLLAGIVLACLYPLAAYGLPPKYFMVRDQRVLMRDETIAAGLNISVDNVTGLYEMLKDGASMELVVAARLERVRTLWTNVTLAEARYASPLVHNPLTREFSLLMPGESRPLLDKNLERLLDATWSKFLVMFGPLSLLDGKEKDTEYRIVLDLALRHAKPPPWLVKSFMLWSENIVDPETVTLPFRY